MTSLLTARRLGAILLGGGLILGPAAMAGTLSTLYAVTGGADGAGTPYVDAHGNMTGVALGDSGRPSVLYSLPRGGSFSVLADFADRSYPRGRVTPGAGGVFHGVYEFGRTACSTASGYSFDDGCGGIWAYAP